MKNKIKYFVLYPLMLLIVILVMTYDVKELISLGVRLPFGEAYWKDSLTNTITTNKSIRLNPGDSLYYGVNTVAVSAGGGDVNSGSNNTLTGNNTFTNGNTFSDSLRANGYTLISDAKITTNLRVTGDVITDLNFLKGSSTSIGTISTDSLAIITNNVKRIVINKNGYTNFTDTVQMSDYVQMSGNLDVSGFLAVTGDIQTLGDITGNNINGQFSASNINSGTLDTARIPNTAKIDTSKFARTDTLTTETNKSINIFTNLITFATTVTFTVSPVFSALVNFANGLTTTTLTASSTATFNGDVVPASWIKNNSSVSAYQYEKVKIVAFKLGATTATTYTAAHGITDWHSIKSYTVCVMDDSSNCMIIPNMFSDDGGSAGKIYNNANIDSLNCRIRLYSASVNLVNDSAFFRIVYTDYNR